MRILAYTVTYSAVPINFSFLTASLLSPDITTLVYNDTKYPHLFTITEFDSVLISLIRLPFVTGCLLYCRVIFTFDLNLILQRNSEYLAKKGRDKFRTACKLECLELRTWDSKEKLNKFHNLFSSSNYWDD
jgi:hypothetical protein